MVSLGAVRSMFVEIGLLNNVTKPVADLNNQIDNVKKNIEVNTKSMRDNLLKVGATLSTIGAAGALFFKSSTKDVADYQDALVGFRKLSGENADMLLADMKRASGGTVDELNAVLNANKAMMMGIDAKKIPEMMEIARAASRTTGQDVTFMFESIAMGTARESKLILDNLGIIVDAEDAHKKYAKSIGKSASQLTEAERKLAFQNAVMEAGNKIIETTDLSQESLNEELQRSAVTWKELKMEITRGALPVIKTLIGGLNSILGIFKGLPVPVQQTLGVLAILVTVIASLLGSLSLLGAALIFMKANLITFIPVLHGAASGAWALAAGVWATLAPLLPFIAAAAALILIIQDLWSGINGGNSVIMNFVNWIKKGVDSLGIFKYALFPILIPFKALQTAIAAIVWAFQNWRKIPEIITNALGAIPAMLRGLVGVFLGAGKMLIDAFLRGISFGLLDTDRISGIFGTLRSYLPFSDAKVGPLADLTLSGQKLIETFGAGAESKQGYLSSLLGGIMKMPEIALGFAAPALAPFISVFKPLVEPLVNPAIVSPLVAQPVSQAAEQMAPISVNVTITGNTISGTEASLTTMASLTGMEIEKSMMKILNQQAMRSGI